MIQKLADFIIRPYRPTYNPNVDLGPTSFSIDNQHPGSRTDFKVVNRAGQTLECSFFQRSANKNKKSPLIVFCHGNTGNRTRSYGAVYTMLQSDVNVVTFDFAGCGLSQGKTISLGYYEQNDIEDVIDYVLKNFNNIDPNRIGLWGRCMGAVSALLFASRTNRVSLLILDTPFADFPLLLRDYIQRVKVIPKWAEDYIYKNLQIKIKEQASFDFEEIVLIKQISKCQIPAFFIHGTNDGIIPANQFKQVYETYPGAKEYIELKTSHNDPRPDFVYQKIAEFVQREFFPSSIYKKIDKNLNRPNPIISSEKSSIHKLLSLDSIKFNENLCNNEEKHALDPVEKALESVRSQKALDFSELLSVQIGSPEHKSPTHYFHEAKENEFHLLGHMLSYNRMEIKTMQQLSARGKVGFTQIGEDESADISDEVVDAQELTNQGYLKVKKTKRFFHNLQKQTS